MDINITSKQAIYLEVATKLENLINLNVYKENECLPSCRNLALTLNVNPNTISRAYSLLESKGVVYTIPKKGIFVSQKSKKKDFSKEICLFLENLKESLVTKEEILKLLDSVYGGNYDKSK